MYINKNVVFILIMSNQRRGRRCQTDMIFRPSGADLHDRTNCKRAKELHNKNRCVKTYSKCEPESLSNIADESVRSLFRMRGRAHTKWLTLTNEIKSEMSY